MNIVQEMGRALVQVLEILQGSTYVSKCMYGQHHSGIPTQNAIKLPDKTIPRSR